MEKVKKYNDFFSEELYSEIKTYVDKIMKDKKTSFTTSLSWQKELQSTSTLIARYDFEKDDIEIFKKIRREIEKKIPYYVTQGVLHVFPNLSYITWHPDMHCKAAFTVYLNEEWDSNWGGYLMYEENDEIKSIKPEKNLGVLQVTPVNHCVTTVNIGADYRISLQFFLTNEKKNIV